MRRERMLRFSLFASVAGLVLLAIFAHVTASPHVDSSQLELHLGKTVIIQDKVVDASYTPKASFLKLGEKRIIVVLFELPSYKFEAGDVVEVEGEVKEYEGELEVIAEEVVCLEC